jgi:hypothetical protein
MPKIASEPEVERRFYAGRLGSYPLDSVETGRERRVGRRIVAMNGEIF